MQFLGDAFGHAAGGNASGLGVANELAARGRLAIGQHLGVVAQTAPHGQGDFGQLRSFARAGFAAHDDDLVAFEQSHNFLALARDR